MPAVLLFSVATAMSQSRQVTFQVATPAPLTRNEAVYVTGAERELGDWKTDVLSLTRTDSNKWSGVVALPPDIPIEFKITRGSWDTEEVLKDGGIPPNHVIEPGGDTNVAISIAAWKDSAPPPPPKITGNYRIHDKVHSKYLRLDRKVIVWLPPSYDKDPTRRYPVLYMHDGQQVFDPQTSTHQQDWEVDETCTKLMAEGKMQEIIVVAVYCTVDRFDEYNASVKGQNYAKFLIEELKPFIDKEYRTLPDRDHTAVAGSSMGGKMSFYLAWTHPEVYFGAACLSPAFVYDNNELELGLVRRATQCPDIKIYLYCGEGDELEKKLMPGMQEMTRLLVKRGFAGGENLLIDEDPPAPHNEAAWARHTPQWLLFLFGKRSQP